MKKTNLEEDFDVLDIKSSVKSNAKPQKTKKEEDDIWDILNK